MAVFPAISIALFTPKQNPALEARRKRINLSPLLTYLPVYSTGFICNKTYSIYIIQQSGDFAHYITANLD